MYVSYLREFIELAYCLNFSKTAANLNTTQSSLSKHILALEEECGSPLLNRSSTRVRLTQAGQVLFEEAIVIVNAHDEALKRIKSLKSDFLLSIGGLYRNSTVLDIINRTLERVHESGHTISPCYNDYRHRPYLELLEERSVDLVVTMLERSEVIDDILTSIFLFNDPMIAVVKNNHPLATMESLHVNDLNGQTVITPVGSYSITGAKTVNSLYKRYGIHPKERMVFLNAITELVTVQTNEDLIILEKSLFDVQPFPPDYVAIPFIEEDACFSFYAVYRNDNESPALNLFIKAFCFTIVDSRCSMPKSPSNALCKKNG